MEFHDLFNPTGPSSFHSLLQLVYEPIPVQMEQGSDTFETHFCLCPEFIQGRFEVLDFRCVPLCPYLVLVGKLLFPVGYLRQPTGQRAERREQRGQMGKGGRKHGIGSVGPKKCNGRKGVTLG